MKGVDSNSRFEEVTKTLEEQGFGKFIKGKIKISETLKNHPEKRMRTAIEKLGGGFLLAGLFLAHRVDLIKSEYCKEFSRIKEIGIPSSFSEIEKTIINTYHRPVNTVFKSINGKCEESTILTQTHKATLINGERVFVKVIKEKGVKQVKEDLMIMKYLTAIIDNKNLEEIFKEFKEHVDKKLTLKKELKFLKNSSKAYGSDFIPTPKEELCSDHLIIFTYEKNILKKSELKQFDKEIRTIKGEVLILIIGILVVLISLGFNSTIKTASGISGIIIVIIALIIGLKEKLK